MQKILSIAFLLVVISFSGHCQLLNDSARTIYNAKTTQSFTLNDVLLNTGNRAPIDTSIINLHQYAHTYKNGILYQDLGALGTPLNRVYYEQPTALGRQLGLSSFQEYGYQIDSLKFYDTKSPFTKLGYIQGTRGQQLLELGHTQNIKPHWNAGFNFRRMISLKQIGVSERQEKQASHYAFSAQTSYHSKNDKYLFLFGVTHLQHQQYENGGIFVDSGETKQDMFDYKLERVQLYSLASSRVNKKRLRSYERNSTIRFYNQYALLPKTTLQLFHQFDYKTTTYRFDDDYLYNSFSILSNQSYYPTVLNDTLSTHDRAFFEAYDNKVGLKGKLANLSYVAYLRRRDLNYVQRTSAISRVNRYAENYIGGSLQYTVFDSVQANVNVEHLLGRDFVFDGSIRSNYLSAGYSRYSYSPTLFQESNISNHYEWQRSFNNTQSDYLYVKGRLAHKKLLFAPFVSFTSVRNMIYFDQTAAPAQANESVNFLTGGLTIRVNWKKLFLENTARYTQIEGVDTWRAPKLLNQARLYVYGPIFKKALLLQVGVEATWRSGYYGNAYTPAMSRFYLSDKADEFNFLDGYLLADVFINAQIKRGLVFLKLSHANQGIPSQGFFITPYYTGLPRSFEFGINWLFYD